jgi:hypothetical protein
VHKLHTKVAAWRQYLRANSTSPEGEALLGAKMIGRWPSGALTLGRKGPVAGHHDGTGSVTIPEKPVRRRLQNLPSFVVTRGGEYCFLPGLRALRWLAELEN